MARAILPAGLAAASAVLSGCATKTPAQTPAATQADFHPQYLGIETILLEGNLVDFRVAMKGARTIDDVTAYARCAAAQYALIRGYNFARHVRTNVDQQGGTGRADAVYTISEALPKGLRTIDAEVTVEDCSARGIPTV